MTAVDRRLLLLVARMWHAGRLVFGWVDGESWPLQRIRAVRSTVGWSRRAQSREASEGGRHLRIRWRTATTISHLPPRNTIRRSSGHRRCASRRSENSQLLSAGPSWPVSSTLDPRESPALCLPSELDALLEHPSHPDRDPVRHPGNSDAFRRLPGAQREKRWQGVRGTANPCFRRRDLQHNVGINGSRCAYRRRSSRYQLLPGSYEKRVRL